MSVCKRLFGRRVNVFRQRNRYADEARACPCGRERCVRGGTMEVPGRKRTVAPPTRRRDVARAGCFRDDWSRHQSVTRRVWCRAQCARHARAAQQHVVARRVVCGAVGRMKRVVKGDGCGWTQRALTFLSLRETRREAAPCPSLLQNSARIRARISHTLPASVNHGLWRWHELQLWCVFWKKKAGRSLALHRRTKVCPRSTQTHPTPPPHSRTGAAATPGASAFGE